MAKSPVARRYANALFELGIEHDELEALGSSLESAKKMLNDSDDLRAILRNPAVELGARRKIIRAVGAKAEWPTRFQNFICLLLDRDRLQVLGDIAEAFATRHDEHLGRVRARVTSATALDDDQRKALQGRLEALTGKDVIMRTDVDDELIGGAVARVGGTIYDGSVRTHLQRMREAILKEV